MKNIFQKETPEPTTAWRVEQIADLDAEERRHEGIEDAALRKRISEAALSQTILPESEEQSPEK